MISLHTHRCTERKIKKYNIFIIKINICVNTQHYRFINIRNKRIYYSNNFLGKLTMYLVEQNNFS